MSISVYPSVSFNTQTTPLPLFKGGRKHKKRKQKYDPNVLDQPIPEPKTPFFKKKAVNLTEIGAGAIATIGEPIRYVASKAKFNNFLESEIVRAMQDAADQGMSMVAISGSQFPDFKEGIFAAGLGLLGHGIYQRVKAKKGKSNS
jgi:hypothetical protein